MRLSEAIRLGAMMKPQGFGPSTYPMTSCALQSGLDAMGKSVHASVFADALEIWPFLRNTQVCPECAEHSGNHCYWIIGIHLNDIHKWTRERIADWVESIEPAEPAPVSPACEARESLEVEA